MPLAAVLLGSKGHLGEPDRVKNLSLFFSAPLGLTCVRPQNLFQILLFEQIHMQIAFLGPFGSSNVVQPGRAQHQDGMHARESAIHFGATVDFPHNPLQSVIGSNPVVMAAWKILVLQGLTIIVHGNVLLAVRV